MYVQHIQSPLGLVRIQATAKGISEIVFVQPEQQTPDQPSELTQLAANQLQAYFSGNLQQFSLPLDATGTVFQQQVWQQLCTVGFGKTCSYSTIANGINNPKAVRAVGAANGRNPVSIVVPCHRIIGANGTLTGYAGGLDKKAWLLAHEKQFSTQK
ncbi:methylated-DNA--[protein]-cysteine S-methyltransferase [Chromatiaceae bacterium AAb-1]|nr:methylated-DNA--[protein]-cysteine S-methyltransferase [Chromatiaceae bacterium AAb-1]